MRSKIFETEIQALEVQAVLQGHGYKTELSEFSSTGIDIKERPSSRYATLQVSGSNGFYISTTGTWLKENDDADLYASELSAAAKALADIKKILQG